MEEKKNVCAALKKCGGCQWLYKPYALQLKEKLQWTREQLKAYCKVDDIAGMEQPLHYRHKVHAVFAQDRKRYAVSGKYAAKSHEVVPVDTCYLEHRLADAIISSIRDLLASFKIRPYDEDREMGLLRHVLVRIGYETKEVMVVLVLSSPMLPGKKNFVKVLRAKHPEITTLVLNVNDKRTSMVLGAHEEVLFGKGYICDRLLGKVFRISPKSFYQVNPIQAQVLYEKALDGAHIRKDDIVLDAYCGTGTISILASDRCAHVIGVEKNPDAIRDAKVNARENDAKNTHFYVKDAGDFCMELAASKEKVDVVILDPPRKGAGSVFIESLCRLKPRSIVYISCQPLSLAQDLKLLTQGGYRARLGSAVDMFPYTKEVECVVWLERKS
ncbi:MAG: 23S rRNA (uracil(1939)-C(5))-methyltransferase RlmD [Clostridium sp.]|jgi:23S rRNA (uracil1939-C5)-methyltransferase|nr:23S rRNA (uracil(1939)-C(5))-methyltransferase RlmD [Clostridium sp.]